VLTAVRCRAEEAPGRPALRSGDVALTYDQMCRSAQSVACGLCRRGARPGDRVVLYMPNSIEWVVTALGCLWAGVAFVPLSVEDPPARAAHAIRDCGATLVVALEDAPALSSITCTTWAELAAEPGDEAPYEAEPADLAYIIYTSGTTGAPKGVCIGRKAFGWSVAETVPVLGLGQHSRALAVSAFHFDGSFATVFPALAAGGLLVIARREQLLFLRPFFDAVLSERVTHTSCSPSYLRLLLASRQLHRLSSSDLVSLGLGGEECQPADVAKLWQVLPHLRIFNYYGPTETTISVTNYAVTADDVARGRVPLGWPHAGCRMVVVDEAGTVHEGPSAVGELYIGGEQLMNGYFGDEELTRQVVRADIVAGLNMYKTGDLGEVDGYGRFFYAGRTDDVVKRNGVRISLSELARALRSSNGADAACCALFDNKGRPGIVAFVATGHGKAASAAEMLDHARSVMPANMLPDAIVLVDRLPLTSSGKADWRRLLAEHGYPAWPPAPTAAGP
ncbi:MAG TPA: amino acid adenylation domain-containing protein, partial [Acidimicrobiales bacterium]|nr:amino acid adenylation domain-containing protein [Acidimicrobiales bacterium]